MIVYPIPSSSGYIESAAVATATLNVPTVGYYDLVAQTGIVLMPGLVVGALYYVERTSFVASVEQGAYLEAVDWTPGGALTRPQVIVKRTANSQSISPRPFPCVAYSEGVDANAFFKCTVRNDTLVADFSGRLQPTAALVGVNAINLVFGLRIYEITSHAFIDKYDRGTL